MNERCSSQIVNPVFFLRGSKAQIYSSWNILFGEILSFQLLEIDTIKVFLFLLAEDRRERFAVTAKKANMTFSIFKLETHVMSIRDNRLSIFP